MVIKVSDSPFYHSKFNYTFTFWNEIGISFTISCVSSRDDSRKIKKDDEFWHILKHKIPGCMSKLHRYELNRYGRAWPEKSDIPLEIAKKSVRLDG